MVSAGFCACEISYESTFETLAMLRRVARTSTRMFASPGTRNVCGIVKLPFGWTVVLSIWFQLLPALSDAWRWRITLSPATKGDTVPLKVTLLAGPVSRLDPSVGPLIVTSENTFSWMVRLRAPTDFTYQLRFEFTMPFWRKNA